jgi:hypothetical protein
MLGIAVLTFIFVVYLKAQDSVFKTLQQARRNNDDTR